MKAERKDSNSGVLLCEETGFVLAGGTSSRMGADKAGIEVLGASLLSRAVSCLTAVTSRIVIIGRSSYADDSSLPCYSDIVPGLGPLGGIQTGLRELNTSVALFAPCDCPLLTPRVFEILVDALGNKLAAVPHDSTGRVHPLVGAFRKDCLEPLEARLSRGQRSVLGLIESLAEAVALVDVSKEGVEDSCFLNINTPASLERALRLMQDP